MNDSDRHSLEMYRSEEREASEYACGNWLHRDGPMPSYATLAATVIRHVREWRRDKSDGMDILASADLDNAIDLLQAMRDV